MLFTSKENSIWMGILLRCLSSDIWGKGMERFGKETLEGDEEIGKI